METNSIPQSIRGAIALLQNKGFSAYIVGGCVRDLIRKKTPKDWDITTNANPEQIQELFPKTFYNNKYGTVTIVDEDATDPSLTNIEITPFRVESGYSDKRHPDSVTFTENVEDDLARRDFTMNSIALDTSNGQIIDPYKGQEDIKDKIIRAVGNPSERFSEDALRMLRAVRLSTELGFIIEKATSKAIFENAKLLDVIAKERIQDEFNKVIVSREPKQGIELMEKLGILKFIVPELRDGLEIEQNEAHAFHVFEHNLRTLQHAAKKDWPFHVRLAALFHDIAKPETRRWNDEKKNWTFYGHDVVGARKTKKILSRLKYSKEIINTVTKLVRYHLFFSDVDKITMSSVRRLIVNVGKDYIWDLMKVRACDRIGTGRPKEAPYRLRKFEAMIEEALRDPITVGMLKIDGGQVMDVTREKPGPRIGLILHALLEEVLDDPNKNEEEYLKNRTLELVKLSDEKLRQFGEKGRVSREKAEEEEIKKIRESHWVE